MTTPLEHVSDLAAYVTEAPTSFHAAAEASRRLVAAGFTAVDERVGGTLRLRRGRRSGPRSRRRRGR